MTHQPRRVQQLRVRIRSALHHDLHDGRAQSHRTIGRNRGSGPLFSSLLGVRSPNASPWPRRTQSWVDEGRPKAAPGANALPTRPTAAFLSDIPVTMTAPERIRGATGVGRRVCVEQGERVHRSPSRARETLPDLGRQSMLVPGPPTTSRTVRHPFPVSLVCQQQVRARSSPWSTTMPARGTWRGPSGGQDPHDRTVGSLGPLARSEATLSQPGCVKTAVRVSHRGPARESVVPLGSACRVRSWSSGAGDPRSSGRVRLRPVGHLPPEPDS
jgi:hypothetical protein